MTNQQHPLTPPPDKIHNWLQLEKIGYTIEEIITAAAQWGADQELEACKQWLSLRGHAELAIKLAYCMRNKPEPPRLKEQALEAQYRLMTGAWRNEDWQLISRALEALDD